MSRKHKMIEENKENYRQQKQLDREQDKYMKRMIYRDDYNPVDENLKRSLSREIDDDIDKLKLQAYGRKEVEKHVFGI